MNAPVSTRPATESDYELLFAIHERLFRDHIEWIWGWDDCWQRKNFLSNWKACSTELIESNCKIIGYLQTMEVADYLYLKNIGLLREWQGGGIGAFLMRGLQTRAAALDFSIRLSVFTTNPRAQCFYERLGFVTEDQSGEFNHMVWMAGDS